MVPVLPPMSERFRVPWARAAVPERVTSCSRLFITKALRASMARGSSDTAGGVTSEITRPLWSVTLAISQGFTRYPPLANTA
ncbi:hypothetical protein D3C86_2075880 [compost metagenome]